MLNTKDPEVIEMKNWLLSRMHLLWCDCFSATTPSYERVDLRGRCDEIRRILLYNFGMKSAELDLVEEYSRQFVLYHSKKEGGYISTSDKDGNSIWIKDGKVVKPKFWLPDNGIGDERALEAERVFGEWKSEHHIDELELLRDAGIV